MAKKTTNITNAHLKRWFYNQRSVVAINANVEEYLKSIASAVLVTSATGEIETKKGLNEFIASIGVANTAAEKKLLIKEINDLYEFGYIDADFENKLLNKVSTGFTVTALSNKKVRQSVDNDFILGNTANALIKNFSSETKNKINTAAREAYRQGLSVEELKRQIIGTRSSRYKNGILYSSQRDGRTLSRTLINGVANNVSNRFAMLNDDIYEGWQYIATFDNRTSQICRGLGSLDTIYPIGEGPLPPQHPNCRSTIGFVLKDEYKENNITTTKRARGDDGFELVDKNITYDVWLRTQSDEFVGDVLSGTQYKLFKKGINLNKFVDNFGDAFSMAELKVKYNSILN